MNRASKKNLPNCERSNPDLFIAVGLPLDARAAERALELAKTDVDTIHFYGSDNGREVGC